MILDSLHNLILEKSVRGYCFCDWDGLPLKSEGIIPETMPPLVVQLLKNWSGEEQETWREIKYLDRQYHICSGSVGILVVVADADVNIGLIRIRAGELFTYINENIGRLFVQGASE